MATYSPYTLRRATEADQPTIQRMVSSERLNPRDVHWQNFIIAEDEDERIIGIGQIRLHDRVKELGSLVVLPEYRGQGVGAAIMQALETRGGYPMHLMCGAHNVAYYQRFGYRLLADGEIPREMMQPAWAWWIIRKLLRIPVQFMCKDSA
jgi:amino-acid N-acetyltransferase